MILIFRLALSCALLFFAGSSWADWRCDTAGTSSASSISASDTNCRWGGPNLQVDAGVIISSTGGGIPFGAGNRTSVSPGVLTNLGEITFGAGIAYSKNTITVRNNVATLANPINNLSVVSGGSVFSEGNAAIGIANLTVLTGASSSYANYTGTYYAGAISSAIYNQAGAFIGQDSAGGYLSDYGISNAGTINGGAIVNSGAIFNAGTISGVSSAILNNSGGVINNSTAGNFFSAVANMDTGVLKGGIANSGDIGTNLHTSSTYAITNYGSITAPTTTSFNNGWAIYNAGNIGSSSSPGITNGIQNNTPTGTIAGIYNASGAYIGSIANSGGVISNSITNDGGRINEISNSFTTDFGVIDSIINKSGGVITGEGSSSYGYAINNFQAKITTGITNESSANIVGGISVTGYGSEVASISNAGTICSVTGANTCTGTTTGAAINIGSQVSGFTPKVTTITNTGSIIGAVGIQNAGSITTLNNAQGAGNSNGALTYSGALPTNYSIIVNGTSNFGQLSLTSPTGSMAFGINSSSILQANHTYLGVLQGLSNLSSVTNTSGIYSGSAWSLIANTATPGWWNLGYALVTSTDISGAGTIYQSSNLGSSVNPVFDGGTLQVSSAGTISNNFTVDANNGVIDQHGVASNFSGVISNAVSSTPGSMTIANSGSGGAVTLSGINTYTGLTTINSGATLALSGTGSIAASSSLVDNGTLDISATTSGATVNAISGSGAVTLGAKSLTVANAAGNLAGVIGGTGGLNITGGTQTLSGTNTFSGGVQVQSGAALSIASSNALGSGALALIGSATVPATLNITDTTAIANAITVAGDPVFNITTGTTTTVSSPITDGGVAGDVVVAGGGTLNLTAVNSYTGLTAIGAGSTLALTGISSITPSVSVTNNGTLNVTSKTGNVALGASFTQTSSGSLVMGFSPTSNQRLQIAGAAVLAGSLSLQATGGTYSAGKYTLLSANGVSGRFGTFSSNLSSYTNLAYLLGYDANDVYLTLFSNGPSTADTQQSLVNTAASLQSIYTLQNSVLANSLNYDCTEFGPHGICISVGGRNTAVSAANGLNNTSGLLIGAYRPYPNYRVGAYIDQNLSVNNAGSTVNLGNNTPVIGVFGAWNQNVDGTGTEVKVTAAFGQKNTTVTRSVVGTSEAGSGSSQLNSQGAQVVAKYGFGIAENVIVNPYAGIRYTQNNMGGYTEGTSATVTAPLTYNALNTNATTALAGVGATYRFIPKATVFASAGVESDTNTANGTYAATGVTGLTPINFNANSVKTRPTATLGTYYDIEKNQRVGVTGVYRQEPYQGVSTTSVMATYTVGL